MKKKIRVLIVDDSALTRRILADLVSSDSELEVAGVARDGIDAIKKTRELDPDVITMDIYMPEMDGLAALEFIMMKMPKPVVMVSSLTKKGAVLTLKALELGAVDFIAKPGPYPTSLREISVEILEKIKAAAKSKIGSIKSPGSIRHRGKETLKPEPQGKVEKVVVIGASAGGPRALAKIIPEIPPDIPAPIVLVQHMPATFTESFASRLDARSVIGVKLVSNEEELRPGVAFVVPGGWDMAFEKDGNRVKSLLKPTGAKRGASPAIDVTMESAAKTFGSGAVGVLLSGMGSDGALGLGMIKDAGGITIAEHKSTCLVYGMPKVAIERNLAMKVVPLDEIVKTILDSL